MSGYPGYPSAPPSEGGGSYQPYPGTNDAPPPYPGVGGSPYPPAAPAPYPPGRFIVFYYYQNYCFSEYIDLVKRAEKSRFRALQKVDDQFFCQIELPIRKTV